MVLDIIVSYSSLVLLSYVFPKNNYFNILPLTKNYIYFIIVFVSSLFSVIFHYFYSFSCFFFQLLCVLYK